MHIQDMFCHGNHTILYHILVQVISTHIIIVITLEIMDLDLSFGINSSILIKNIIKFLKKGKLSRHGKINETLKDYFNI
jgi:hypothetical protein